MNRAVMGLLELGIVVHFLYRIFFKKEKTAANGFGAAVFLFMFWSTFNPFIAKWIKAFFY